ncbi:MAG: triose-phosphate isomerase [Planctomycetes bacterium]|nr:triose-phosphate isomerase [Planctomycetota bacterium]
MPTRKPFVGGNWKMNLNRAEARALAQSVASALANGPAVEAAVFPPFPYLSDVGEVLGKVPGNAVKLGAQDFYHQPNGAFTGEVSLAMLKDLGVQVVLVGHSERRHVIGECDVLINTKVRAALDAGLEVILCVGEKLEQRELGQTDAINAAQMVYGLAGVKPEQMSRVTIAYEPVWAIGTGKNATPADAQSAHRRLRETLIHGLFGQAVGEAVRIQYGGSVKAANAKELFTQPDIDGGLIGGASLKAEEFAAIVKAAAK